MRIETSASNPQAQFCARPVQPISQVLKPTTLSAVRTSLNARYGQLGTDLSLEELGLKS